MDNSEKKSDWELPPEIEAERAFKGFTISGELVNRLMDTSSFPKWKALPKRAVLFDVSQQYEQLFEAGLAVNFTMSGLPYDEFVKKHDLKNVKLGVPVKICQSTGEECTC